MEEELLALVAYAIFKKRDGSSSLKVPLHYRALLTAKRGPDSVFLGFGAIAAYDPKTKKNGTDSLHGKDIWSVPTF